MIDTVSNKTFHFNRLAIDLHPEVYDPAEDSFLLIKALKIRHRDKVLEIGTGCGLIALECARRGAHVVYTDINPFAVQLAHHNWEKNSHMVKGAADGRQGDLFSPIEEGEFFDVIIFNPPYLPTTEREKIGGWFDVATNGGTDGIRVIIRFLENLRKYLSQNGLAYFVFSSLSNRADLEKHIN
ncbi:MAG: HemK2/MTQ2 family protein methyltransferase, partial [Petrotogales bacterium]